MIETLVLTSIVMDKYFILVNTSSTSDKVLRTLLSTSTEVFDPSLILTANVYFSGLGKEMVAAL